MYNFPEAGYNLLLVEDNPGDILLISNYLEQISSEIRIESAKTYHEASVYLRNRPGIYDVILLDLKLTDLEGEDLIKAILELSETVPVIVLTGHDDMQFSIKSLSMGVSDYILKDNLNPHVLGKSIRYAIERNLSSKKLQLSERRYRYLFENNPSSILILDLESRRIVDTNKEAQKKYQYSTEQFEKLNVETIQANGSDAFFPGKGTLFSEGESLILRNNVFNHRKRNGDVFFAEVRGHQIMYQGRESAMLMINDVTDKIEMQDRLLESTLRAEEDERNRIAGELHDGIVQQLVACGMFTQTIEKKLDHDSHLAAEVDRLYELIIKTTTQTRDISHNLKSAEFEGTTFCGLMNQLMRQLTHAGSLIYTFNNHLAAGKDYNTHFKTNIYRSIQELCNNILKHSKATTAVITIEEIMQILYITINDNGIGFTYSDNDRLGLGIKNVESRIHRLGGVIDFIKSANGGLQVDMEIPVNFACPDSNLTH